MTRRSTAKKIDYSKFGTSGSSSDDDDFENNAPTTKKPRREKLVKEKVPLKEKAKNKEYIEPKNVEKKGRNSRTSNYEQIFEKELHTALEASKSAVSPRKENIQEKVVINIDADSDEERIMKVIGNKKLTSETESDGSAFADTLPIKKHKLTTTDSDWDNTEKSNQDMNLYAEDDDSDVNACGQLSGAIKEDDEISFTKVSELAKKDFLETPTLKVRSKKTLIAADEIVASKKIAITHTSTRSGSNCNQTSVRLRLGLSRRIKVSKPLHQNVDLKIL